MLENCCWILLESCCSVAGELLLGCCWKVVTVFVGFGVVGRSHKPKDAGGL